MKIKFLVFLLFWTCTAIGQSDLNNTFDSSNYYNHYFMFNNPNIKGTNLTGEWVQIEDALPIIIEEIKNLGCDSLIKDILIQIDTSKYISLSVYCKQLNFGVLYTQDHDAIPKIQHRKNRLKDEYFQVFSKINGEAPIGKDKLLPLIGKDKLLLLTKLPENVILLTQNCYWFQSTGNKKDDKYLVTKDVALRILRQDIKAY